MAKLNRAGAPYYDDYDNSKQYTHLLAIPGRVAQAREITQLQSVVKDIVKGIGDELYRDKVLASGCSVTIESKNVNGVPSRYVNIEPGKVYLDGMVLPVGIIDSDGVYQPAPATLGPLSNLPTEAELAAGVEVKDIVGVYLEEVLVTESQDSTLHDPAQGYDNFSQAGCHRVKSMALLKLYNYEAGKNTLDKLNADGAFPIAEIINGALLTRDIAPDYGGISELLATRTKEESGSYIVEGLKTRVLRSNTKDSYYTLNVDRGIAYIDGYRREIPSMNKYIDLPTSSSDMIVINSSRSGKKYIQGSDILLYDKGPYVESITLLEAVKSTRVSNMPAPASDTQTISKPETEAREIYQHSITKASQGSTNYVEGTHYTVDRENWSITWISSTRPTGSYSFEYQYLTRGFKYGEDYYVSVNDQGQSVLRWRGTNIPVNDTTLYVDIKVWKARKDIVYIDTNGDIGVVKGAPAEVGKEGFPAIPSTAIALSHIYVSPRDSITNPAEPTSTISLSNVGLTRFTMSDIHELLKRVRSLEYTQANLSLQDDSKSRTVSGSKNSIFADPLIDFSKVEYAYNNGANPDPELPRYDATIDFRSNTCYLPVSSDLFDLEYDTLLSTSRLYDRLITLPETSTEIILSQDKATSVFSVNPYGQFPKSPEVSLTPAIDNWIDINYIDVTRYQSAEELVEIDTEYIEVNNTSGSRRPSTSTSTSVDTVIGTKVEVGNTSESVLYEEAIPYIRNDKLIKVVGSQFPENRDIYCYFDGVLAKFINDGVEADTVRTDEYGSFNTSIKIPDRIPTGIKEVKFTIGIDGYGSEGEAYALYQANGTLQSVERTTTVINKILQKRVTTVTTTNYIDPVGETFVLSDNVLLNAVEVYFAAKPSDDIPITCDIREVVNGSITATVLGHKTLHDVYTDSEGRVATRFKFDDPVYLESNKEYAFVLRSVSNQYKIWVAELGKEDYITKNPVLSNPYLVGAMMSSSNNSSWTVHQDMDIKFNLIAGVYNTRSADVYFKEVTKEDLNFSRLYLVADSITPNNTSVSWYYRVDGESVEHPISTYDISLFEDLHSKVTIRAHIEKNASASRYLSPVLAKDTSTLMTSKYKRTGEYISVTFPGNKCNTADIILDTYSIATGDIKVYYSTDEGTTLHLATIPEDDEFNEYNRLLNYGWREQTYRVNLPMDEKAERCKLFVEFVGSTNENDAYVAKTPAIRKIRVINYTRINDN